MVRHIGWWWALLLTGMVASGSTAAEPTDTGRFAQSVNALGWDLYHQQPAGGNLFYSPLSVNQALGLLYLGARGQTQAQMARVLHLGLPEEHWRAANQAFGESLRPAAGRDGAEAVPFTLSSANALFAQQDYAFLPSYLADVKAAFAGANVRTLDFRGDTEGARGTINGWISDQTRGGIPEMIPAGSVSAMTRLVLTNATYFKANWLHTFSEGLTRPGNFTRADDVTVKVPLMHATERVSYAEGEDWQAAVLPYVGGRVSALVLLPRAGKLAQVERGLDGTRLEAMLRGLQSHEVALTLPRFGLKLDLPLKQSLVALGMKDAFNGAAADFSGLDGSRDLAVSEALHKAFAKVDENGTEAGAATAMVVGVTAMPAEPVEMTCDRPFLFLVRENTTGAILFMGRIADPSA